ncbi:hypothetical protein DFQ27_004251 [Actinomortierella ambigua]|uniref:Uncharacterized protein n=1 Tax=Actinomortierella ambigua TaxID=1343610 RepID=A0A9P6U3L8_9FUNG|nr:hypothetical protein DFQ27_004251 [Actinomortierella ambigua]
MLIKSLVVLCSAVVVMAKAPVNAVISGALLIGLDTTNPRASGSDIFRYQENQITALASIAMASARSANFRPAEMPPKILIHYFEHFVQRLTTSPGIHRSHTSDHTIDLNGSLIQLEKAIRELGDKSDDDSAYRLAVIARGLRDLVPGYDADEPVKTWLLNLLALDNRQVMHRRGNVTFTLARVVLNIKADKSHTTHIPEQSAKLTVSTYEVDSKYLQDNADRLATVVPLYNVPAAMAQLTSPPMPYIERSSEAAPVASCHAESENFEGRVEQDHLNWW